MTLYVLAVIGDRATVLERLKTLDGTHPTPWMAHTTRAIAMLGLEDTAQTLSALERTTAAREPWPSRNFAYSPMFAGVRGSARFPALLTRVGLSRK